MKITFLINNFSKTSVPVSWAQSFNKNFMNLKVNIVSVKQFSFTSFRNLINSEIIHGHQVKAMAIFLLFNFFIRKRTIYTVHGSYLYLSKINQYLLKFIFYRSDSIVFVNKFLYDVLPNDYKYIINNKYKIILNGVDTKFLYKQIDIYEKYKLNNDDAMIFHPARFVKEKNHLNIIEAFSLLVKDDSSIKLVFAGDGIMREQIEHKINKLNLSNNIILLGLIDKNDVYNFLEKCDLFIMPSISEGLNIAFLEAMSMKRKIVVSDIPQFRYPFEHYNINPLACNVSFCNPNDIQSIYNIFKISLRNKRNINFNIKVFSLDSMFNNYIKLYKELLNGN